MATPVTRGAHCRYRAPAVVIAGVVLLFGQSRVLAQTLNRDQMRAITHLSCVFPIAAEATWSGETALPPRLKTGATLAFDIEDIDTVDGSARFVDPKGDADVIAKLFAWSLHFLETIPGGAINVTTVFAQESRDGKLRAVHSRADYPPAADARAADISAIQFYGECAIKN
jgi:hypothetical protein